MSQYNPNPNENCANGSKMTTTKLRGYLQVKHNPSNRRSRLPRKVSSYCKFSDPQTTTLLSLMTSYKIRKSTPLVKIEIE